MAHEFSTEKQVDGALIILGVVGIIIAGFIGLIAYLASKVI